MPLGGIWDKKDNVTVQSIVLQIFQCFHITRPLCCLYFYHVRVVITIVGRHEGTKDEK
jgi:hypothetical protein